MIRISGLSSAGARLYDYLVAAAEADISANDVQRILSAAGEGYRRQELLQDYRAVREAVAEWAGMRYTRNDRRLLPERYAWASGVTLRQYYTTVEVRVLDTLTGTRTVRHVTIAHNDPLTAGEIKDMALARVMEVSGGLEPISAVPVAGVRS